MNEIKPIKSRIDELLHYASHLGQLHEKPTFEISEHKQFSLRASQLKQSASVLENISDKHGEIWLKIRRVQRTDPPTVPEELKPWIVVSADPDENVKINGTYQKNLSSREIEQLISQQIIFPEDVSDPPNVNNEVEQQKSQLLPEEPEEKCVTFFLSNHPELEAKIQIYIKEIWIPWALKEEMGLPDIILYEKFFNLYQMLETRDDMNGSELIWGIGQMRWLTPIARLDHPLIEQSMELEIDPDDGAILVKPRKRPATLAIKPFIALQIVGLEKLQNFMDDFSNSQDSSTVPSPFKKESFEPILRQAVAIIDPSGSYWPDVNDGSKSIEANLPPFTQQLKISATWTLYARPRGQSSYVEDISRFREALNRISIHAIGDPIKSLVSEPLTTPEHLVNQAPVTTPFFPKVYNEAQLNIIHRLAQEHGVIVQGPPGTGKTHTIANIICHYLTLGKRVLVTSKGKTALEALRSQIPHELRDLTISLLSNERESFHQLESAIEMLSSIASQTNLDELIQQADTLSHRESILREKLSNLDNLIYEYGLQQLQNVPQNLGNGKTMNAMTLAIQVKEESETHQWFSDKIDHTLTFNQHFNDLDIGKLKIARRTLGEDIVYVGKQLPKVSEIFNPGQVTAIHEDLVNLARHKDRAKSEQLPLLANSVDNVDRLIEQIQPALEQLDSLIRLMNQKPWLRDAFEHWVKHGLQQENMSMLEELIPELESLVGLRKYFVRTPIMLPDLGVHRALVRQAVEKLAAGKPGFNFFSFNRKIEKQLIVQIEVEGCPANSVDEWSHVSKYFDFQDAVRRFVIKWNSIGEDLGLPELLYDYSQSVHFLDELYHQLTSVITFAIDRWQALKRDMAILFPAGPNLDSLHGKSNLLAGVFKSLRCHSEQLIMNHQREKLDNLQKLLANCEGEIVNQFNQAIVKVIGNPIYTSDQVMTQWQIMVRELARLQQMMPFINTVKSITNKIANAGAKQWSLDLQSVPADQTEDVIIPDNWKKSWLFGQRVFYLDKINQPEKTHTFTKQRELVDHDLKQVFIELIRIKTYIGLHRSLTDRVQSALVRFVTAVTKIGKGKGKRAPRHRMEAYRAMQDCYDGVPCWIMPTWRISESLPAEFASFDLVIIDEASQSDISALPAILRAKKILIVGDDKQVSPTGAFITEEKILQLKRLYLKNQPFADLLLPGNSFYDLANAVFPRQRIMLSEHFRCVAPIIQFSLQFYNEPLIPLRMPTASERFDPPLIDIYVKNGIRNDKTRTNSAEKAAIVQEIKALVANPDFGQRSIGVISLIGIQQANDIQETLIEQLGEEIFRKHRIACGDSATFQGKERDIIFLSMVVGPGQGAILSKRENAQRFNVALSRARDRMILVHSITDTELNNTDDMKYKALQFFKRPLNQITQQSNQIEQCKTDLERHFYRYLKSKGYRVTPQVSIGPYTIDLMVEGNLDQRIAIELDGDQYQSAQAWSQQIKRKQTLQRVGWRFWHCWGTQFIMDPGACLENLEKILGLYDIAPVSDKKPSRIYREQREFIDEI